MAAKQYTIRNIPEPVDRYLRKRAKISGKSLNQVVIEELSENLPKPKQSLVESFDWFIGKGYIGDDVMEILAEDRRAQKELMRKKWKKEDRDALTD